MDQVPPRTAVTRKRPAEPDQPISSPVVAGSLPAKSLSRAGSVFKNFSASRFPDGGKPASYVDPAEGPAAVSSTHRRIMTQQLEQLSSADSPTGGMTLALPQSEIARLLPSINQDAATLELSDVLKVVGRQMRGAEFYARGNPVLSRITLRSRARELMAALNDNAAATQPAQGADGAAPEPQARIVGRAEEAKAAPRPRRARSTARQRGAAK